MSETAEEEEEQKPATLLASGKGPGVETSLADVPLAPPSPLAPGRTSAARAGRGGGGDGPRPRLPRRAPGRLSALGRPRWALWGVGSHCTLTPNERLELTSPHRRKKGENP